VDIQLGHILVEAVRVPGTLGADDVDVQRRDIAADRARTASKSSNEGLVLFAGNAGEAAERDVADGQVARVLLAQRQVLLAVTLGDLHGIVDVVHGHVRVRDVGHASRPAAALQVARQRRRDAGPYLDARPVAGVVHADVGHKDALHDVKGARVLAETAYADAVATVAEHGLYQYVGAIGFEGDTVWRGCEVALQCQHEVFLR